jgi:hypothetical protein
MFLTNPGLAPGLLAAIHGPPKEGPIPTFSELTPQQLEALRVAMALLQPAPPQRECDVCAPLRRMGRDVGCSRCDFDEVAMWKQKKVQNDVKSAIQVSMSFNYRIENRLLAYTID